MNTHTTEQLLMCEKGDLVKYIEELREQKEGAFTEGYEEAEESLCVDKEYLDEKEDEIKKLKEGQKKRYLLLGIKRKRLLLEKHIRNRKIL